MNCTIYFCRPSQGVSYGLRLEDGRLVPLPDKHQSGPGHSSGTTARCNDLISWDARWVWLPDVCRYPIDLQLSSPKPAHEDSPALEGTCTKTNLIPPKKSGFNHCKFTVFKCFLGYIVIFFTKISLLGVENYGNPKNPYLSRINPYLSRIKPVFSHPPKEPTFSQPVFIPY